MGVEEYITIAYLQRISSAPHRFASSSFLRTPPTTFAKNNWYIYERSNFIVCWFAEVLYDLILVGVEEYIITLINIISPLHPITSLRYHSSAHLIPLRMYVWRISDAIVWLYGGVLKNEMGGGVGVLRDISIHQYRFYISLLHVYQYTWCLAIYYVSQ